MIEAHQRTLRAPAAPDEGRQDDGGLAALREEIATYRARVPELLREHEGRFVFIKGAAIEGVFADRAAALREGYRRFGVVPFLVKQVAATEPVVYLPNVVP